MRIFLTGASGYIGGTLATRLIRDGHEVYALVRYADKARALEARGLHTVSGDLDNVDLLREQATLADAVINTANADHAQSVEHMLMALRGSGKLFIQTSGSSVIGDDARGETCTDKVYSEDTPFCIAPGKQARHALNMRVLAAALDGVRSVVVCPALIYGHGAGLHRDSIQIPMLVQQAKTTGKVPCLGRGVNRWSTVHIEDLIDLYVLAINSAPAGAFYFAEHGEVSFLELAQSIAARLPPCEIEFLSAQAMVSQWGEAKALFTFAGNSRVRALRAREELAWAPQHGSALDWINREPAL
jgi:nucleoside-diphosphate-sugar epimerase